MQAAQWQQQKQWQEYQMSLITYQQQLQQWTMQQGNIRHIEFVMCPVSKHKANGDKMGAFLAYVY